MSSIRRTAAVLATYLLISLTLLAQATTTAIQGEDLEKFLADGRIARMRDAGSGVTLSQRVTIERNGTTHDALFKTIDVFRPGMSQVGAIAEIDFQDSWQTEVPAYAIDRMLGLGMVPATVERTINGKRGSLQLWVTSMASEEGRQRRGLTPPDAEVFGQRLLKMKLFDQLICNVDRHLNNILITQDFDLRLIDHSRAFRPVNELRNPEQLTRFSKSLLDALPKLEFQDLKKRFGRYLIDRQLHALLKRRDAILTLARQRIAERGEAAVIYP
jgi:hypothetical protein